MSRDYGPDVLAGDWRKARRPEVPVVAAVRGLVVEERDGGFCGAVIHCEKQVVTLADRFGRQRVFPLTRAGFLLEGKPVTLARPAPGTAPANGPRSSPGTGTPRTGTARTRTARTASGSVAGPRATGTARARVARASRIYVEGRHDAELVEKIWGDDLREVGVVVEYLAGVDHLPGVADAFGPGPGRRLGVLVDHLVAGSKESRIAAQVSSAQVLVVGHPFVDIWQAVRPEVLGIPGWPAVPRGTPWKEGVIRALGWDVSTAAAWQRILGAVGSYTDLEPELLGRVEELIDFVTADGGL
ncbi:MAG: DUF3097 domain-containing protein [Nocardiopsaceae bacterium]|nr:DUF3097 domain-containing protein [Nocardiopsaceae bacterium]